MANTVTATIKVVQKERSHVVFVLTNVAFWSTMVAAIAVSRIWLGGSFLVELMAVVFSVLMLAKLAKMHTGVEVTMTPAEIRRWLAAGAPKNVIEWRNQTSQDN